MKKIKIIFLLFVVLCICGIGIIHSTYTDHMTSTENTIIISVCTGQMRGLETGVSVYAGYNKIPLILSDKTLPSQLKNWLPGYIKENNITNIVVVGQLTPYQLFELSTIGVNIKQITGNNIADILTKIADNTEDKNNDTLIFTSSEPIAGELGAYMKVPVFIATQNSSYNSADYLDSKYVEYIKNHNIKHIIIVGSLQDTLKKQLYDFNISIEEINGADSLELSNNINSKLINEGYINNTNTAYYGFFGELPTIVPNVVENNAIMIEDSSNNGDIVEYLKQNNITELYLTRNTESQYILMEEPDYISSQTVKNLQDNNISVNMLVKERTLDEATGLYDNKIITAESIKNNTHDNNIILNQTIVNQEPPIISIINKSSGIDSNDISFNVTKNSNNNYTVKWDTIHPYDYIQINQTDYTILSDNGYEFKCHKSSDDKWVVDYYFNGTHYYNTTWIKNMDNSWNEIHFYQEYKWQFDGNVWYCLNDNSKIIYHLNFTQKDNL